MRPFVYERLTGADALMQSGADSLAPANPGASYLAGGTTLIDLMKLEVMRPRTVIDINALARGAYGRIEVGQNGLRLGALVRMAEAAEHPAVRHQYPVIAQSLQLAASAQLRNMASLGGNVLQRTRCTYFRDVSYAACNKRAPGSGCAAMEGFNRMHAVLGTSEQCIASYPGDFAQALIALDASVELLGPGGARTIPFADLHRPPGGAPDRETTLRPGEMIVAFMIPAAPWTRRSLYLKVRDRQSYEFALASAAVALDQQDGTVRDARIALGGVATVPWRARGAEAALRGRAIDRDSLAAAANAAFAGATGHGHNDFKIELGKRTLTRALQQAAALEV
ncbi:MAG: xanthine dehydrogenase family protein subunit M [Xanthobacteraceae bacterium]